MRNKGILIQASICFGLILANFIAQIPYFFHLYYRRQSLALTLRSSLIMGAVFAVFLIGSILLFRRRRAGYRLMLLFLATEFLFYLWNVAGSTIRGNGLFFQVHNPDLTLRVIYSIGYANLFAAGYFLFLLLSQRAVFLPSPSEI